MKNKTIDTSIVRYFTKLLFQHAEIPMKICTLMHINVKKKQSRCNSDLLFTIILGLKIYTFYILQNNH